MFGGDEYIDKYNNAQKIIIDEVDRLLATCQEEYNLIDIAEWLKSDKHLMTGFKLVIDIRDAKAGCYSSNYYLATVRNYLIELSEELTGEKQAQDERKDKECEELLDKISCLREENKILMHAIIALNERGKNK